MREVTPALTAPILARIEDGLTADRLPSRFKPLALPKKADLRTLIHTMAAFVLRNLSDEVFAQDGVRTGVVRKIAIYVIRNRDVFGDASLYSALACACGRMWASPRLILSRIGVGGLVKQVRRDAARQRKSGRIKKANRALDKRQRTLEVAETFYGLSALPPPALLLSLGATTVLEITHPLHLHREEFDLGIPLSSSFLTMDWWHLAREDRRRFLAVRHGRRPMIIVICLGERVDSVWATGRLRDIRYADIAACLTRLSYLCMPPPHPRPDHVLQTLGRAMASPCRQGKCNGRL